MLIRHYSQYIHACCKSSLTDTQLGSNFNVIAYAGCATPYTHLPHAQVRSVVSLTGLLGHICFYKQEESRGNR